MRRWLFAILFIIPGTLVGALIFCDNRGDSIPLWTHRAQFIEFTPSDAPPLPFASTWPYPSQLFTSGSRQPIPVLRLYRKTASTPVLLKNGSIVLEGDEVQIQYVTKQPFGVILSVDGRGVVSQHYPDEGNTTRITTGTHVLPFAFKLDDAPGYEVFFLITSVFPINTRIIYKAATAIQSFQEPLLLTGENIQVRKIVLHKAIRE